MCDDSWDDDYADGFDDFGDDEAELIDCPACGAEIYEDAVRCPVCSEYVTLGGGGLWAGRSVWWIVLGLAGIVAVIFTLVR